MADKISDLPAAATSFLVDEDECNQSGVSRRVSNAQRMALFKANQYDQDLDTTDAVTFTTVNTGQGANELYAMDQDVKTSDGVTFNSVTLPTAGGTPAALDYYEEFSMTLTFDVGATVWTTSLSTTGFFRRIGKSVTLTFSPSLIGTTNGAPALTITLSPGTLIPARLRTAITSYEFIRTLENNVGLASPGNIIFSFTGEITIIKDGASAAWGANQPTTGLFAGSYTWITS